MSKVTVFCFLFLMACSKPYDPNLPKTLSLDSKHPLGCFLASITRDTRVEPHFRVYEFLFKSRDSGLDKFSVLYRAQYGFFAAPEEDIFYTDFKDGPFAGIFYARNIPAGTYNVDRARLIGLSVQLEAAKGSSGSFVIKPGVCHYIGELRVTPIVGPGLMNQIKLKSATLDVVDSWERDSLGFKKLYPQLNLSTVEHAVLKPKQAPQW